MSQPTYSPQTALADADRAQHRHARGTEAR